MTEREYCEAAERHRLGGAGGYNGDDHETPERDPDAWEMFRERLELQERRCPNPMYTPDFCCRIIAPNIKLEALPANAEQPYGYLISLPDSSEMSGIAIGAPTAQEAWQEAFKFLDRRKS